MDLKQFLEDFLFKARNQLFKTVRFNMIGAYYLARTMKNTEKLLHNTGIGSTCTS